MTKRVPTPEEVATIRERPPLLVGDLELDLVNFGWTEDVAKLICQKLEEHGALLSLIDEWAGRAANLVGNSCSDCSAGYCDGFNLAVSVAAYAPEREGEVTTMNLHLRAEWTDDCCGKKDYDGDTVSISTRYWPPGGGGLVFDTREPERGLRKFDDGTLHTAHSSLVLRHGDCEEPVSLSDRWFETKTFQELREEVECWAQEQMSVVVLALAKAFPGRVEFNGS